MHESVRLYVADAIREYGPFEYVLEIGSRDINGGIRDLFNGAQYLGIDTLAGPGVDIVANGADFGDDIGLDCVVCAEVLEHTEQAPDIVANAAAQLRPGGVFVMTCAGPNRPPHSAIDEEPIRPDEFYRNVHDFMLERWLNAAGFSSWRIDPAGADMRCVAIR